MADIMLRPGSLDDVPELWAIFRAIIDDGTTYVQDASTTVADFREYWWGRGGSQWVAVMDGSVVGGYTLRPNHPGRGSHVATASYVVGSAARGRGLGRRLGEHSLDEARRLGFQSIQFNFVVSTNDPAVQLWKSLGFDIIGILPEAFRHPHFGLVDAYLMHRRL